MSKIYSLDTVLIEGLTSPRALKQKLSLSPTMQEFIVNTRKQIVDILDGNDPRMILIVGPCSIHDVNAAEEYAIKLRHLAKDVSDAFLIIMRTYFEKPRTGMGWKGMLYDPHLDGSNDIAGGLHTARDLLITLAKLEIPTATEFLDPITPYYIGDLISWACIGARTAESQIHRQFASGLPMPIAFKNGTTGNVDIAINGVLTAQSPHTFFGIDESGQASILHTKGNKSPHIVLRGGACGPNYDADSIKNALDLLKVYRLPQRVIIDCSHDNSCRCHEEQQAVFDSVIQQRLDGNRAIRGLAIESHLFGGNQKFGMDPKQLRYAVSVTDPCLDWNSTERLIKQAAGKMIESLSIEESQEAEQQ